MGVLPGDVTTIRGSAFLPAYKAGRKADLTVRSGKIRVAGLLG